MDEAELVRERRDSDGVLEQATEVGVVSRARTGCALELAPEVRVRDERLEQARVVRVVHLARQVLEESVELVEVAIRDGQEVSRVRVFGLRLADTPDVHLQLVTE